MVSETSKSLILSFLSISSIHSESMSLCRFDVDFGQEREILKWIINYLDATKAGLLTHLLGDGGPINIVYHNYDWSVNS